MKSIKTKIAENAKSIKWASIVLLATIAVAAVPYLHAFGELGGEPPQDETVPVAVPLSEADIDEPSPTTSTEDVAFDDAEETTEQAAEDVSATTEQASESVAISTMSDSDGENTGISTQSVLTSITWNNKAATINAGDTVNLSSSERITAAGTYTLTVNGTLNITGGIELSNNVTLILKGPGTVTLTQPVTLNGNGAHTLEVDTTLKGNIDVGSSQNLVLQGSGTIDGTGKNRSVITVTGRTTGSATNLTVTGANGGRLKITGGTGTKPNLAYNSNDPNATAGGGILVRNHSNNKWGADLANLVVNDVEMCNNSADAGGAIFIDYHCSFTMTNGSIHDNTANTHEGGGLFTRGPSEITGGQFLQNHTYTDSDWGGGGIFVENNSTLNFGDSKVLITKNSADSYGGGISGCPHAKAGIGTIGGSTSNNAIAIYGNSAGSNITIFQGKNAGLWKNPNGNGDWIAAGTPGFTADKAQDYYCTFASVVMAQNYLTDESYSWKGIAAFQNGKVIDPLEITSEGQGFAGENVSVGLTAAKPSVEPSGFQVVIRGNTSTTHGGGIGCNGEVVVGSIPRDITIENTDWVLEFKKSFTKLDNRSALTDGAFSFGIYTDEDCTQLVPSDWVKDSIVSNDGNGNVRFTMKGYYPGSDGTQSYDFYVKEIATDVDKKNNPNIDYDDAVRKVTVTIKTTTSSTGGWKNISTTTSEVESVKYYSKNEAGAWIESKAEQNKIPEASVFQNKVKPTQDKRNVTNGWSMTFDKAFTSVDGANLYNAKAEDLSSKNVSTQFQFGLYVPNPNDESLFNEDGTLNEDALKVDGEIDSTKLTQVAQASNATSGENVGKVTFNFVTDKKADEPLNDRVDAEAYRPTNSEGTDATQQTFTFFVKELLPAENQQNDRIDYDTAWHKVEVTVKTSVSVGVDDKDKSSLTPVEWTTYTSSVADSDIKYFKAEKDEQNNTIQFVSTDGNQFTNMYRPEGDFSLNVTKEFYGDTANATGRFNFSMVNIPEPNLADNEYDLSDSPNDITLVTAQNGAFINNTATVAFDKVSFVEPGDYWFMISEDDAADTATDSRIYVIKVNVVEHDSGLVLSSEVTDAYYADGVSKNPGTLLGIGAYDYLELNKLWSKPSADAPDDQVAPMPTLEFSNFSNGIQTFSLSAFAVNAATNEPIDQQCFVDPKIIKNLSGRSLMEGEFNFKLIELYAPKGASQPDWSQTEGPAISETSNDVYGMVDFDKANNVSGDLENPSCLAYTRPGTYFYRVVEANEKTDPTIDYSDQIITFTTVIEEVGDKLVCTDMYYGHVEDGKNIRYDESSDPNWHPDMYNFAKNMSLQVRKTSALDRDKGLEGASYGLYAVNNGAQADILLGESTSDADGWITFEDLSLNKGTLYYFKEVAAPAGHTVSEFRSAYFYLVDDSSSPNGYSLEYSDNKIDLGEKATEAELAAASEAPIMSIASDEVAISAQSDNAGDDIMKFVFARDGGVYDEATNVEFTKLDTRTHEWVEGADLSIIEKSTGKVVNNWVSGKSAQKLQGVLNVGTVYILRENSAPEGYAKAEDVEFQIGQYGAVEILKGQSNGNAEIQDSTIALYDTMLDGENLITEYREVPEEPEDDVTIDEGGILPKLGDFMKVAGPVIIAIVVLLLLVRASRRRKEGQE